MPRSGLVLVAVLAAVAVVARWPGGADLIPSGLFAGPAALVPTTAGGAGELRGRARVIDGDTLELAGETVRLFAADAPEGEQTCRLDGRPWRCGNAATTALRQLVAGRELRCREKDRDRYGRVVAVCYAGGEDINAAMVRQGWALAYTAYATDYVPEEGAAREEGAGLWRSEFMPPWDWRRRQDAAAPTPPGGCAIKGNIARDSGERIYHVPGQRYYGRTRISPERGERWFCSEAEARAAGWRRAKL